MKLMVLATLALFFSLCPTHASQTSDHNRAVHLPNSFNLGRDEATALSLRGISRLLAQHNPRAAMTCNVFPRICRAKGSPGPDCCKKQCVNVMTDRLNCGQCGNKCKYGEACCHGNCINIMYDRRNCGGCHNKCKKGSYCRYGMCSYA